MDQVLQIANGPALWLLATLIVSIVVVQALLYLRMTLNFSNQFQILTPEDRRVVYKTAVINSIGPAVAIFFVAVSLIAMVGGPVTLMRIGVIGSAIFEFVAADLGAKAVGAELGTESYDLQAFTTSVWVMTLGGMGWLVTTLLLTRTLDRTQDKLSVSNPALIKAVGTATPIAIFFILGAQRAINKQWLSNISVRIDDLAAILVSAGLMVILHRAGHHRPWLREWAVGFALIAGISVGYLLGRTLA
ncbi:DUF5058 family protein [Paracoccus sp. (in: a-proteobacteria)]|uniref:DUF5058 family protein n=1 Tax=Paracoccus sp. TaxID=267 RepID=UPI003A883018